MAGALCFLKSLREKKNCEKALSESITVWKLILLGRKTKWIMAPYQPKNIRGEYDPTRPRKLLLHKEELKELSGKLDGKSWSLLPLRAYLKKGIVKLELGLGRPKKTRDKRESIKKKDIERDIQRKL